MKAEELLRRYTAGERDFAGVDLRESKIIDAQLPKINLQKADLSGADLTRTDLQNAVLRNSKFICTNLQTSPNKFFS